MGFTLITVTATYLKPDLATPADGRVEFRLRTTLRNTDSDEIVEAHRISAELDDNGSISVDLVATDDVATVPTGVPWDVIERIAGSRPRSFSMTLSHTLPGGTVDLADVAPVTDVQMYEYALVGHVHTASTVPFTPTGSLAATTVQAALAELDAELTALRPRAAALATFLGG